MNDRDYKRVANAIEFIRCNVEQQPTLADVSAHVSVSEFHLQRMFKRFAGISPKRYLQFVTANRAADLLLDNISSLDATYSMGLSSSSRLHELFVNIHAMTPAEFTRQGENLTIRSGTAQSPVGPCEVAATDKGICWLQFQNAITPQALEQRWPRARFTRDDAMAQSVTSRLFGDHPDPQNFNLHVHGTNFQIRVWQALLDVPEGSWASYSDVAGLVGRPGAVRAVASAVARNDIAMLIPCHRVLRSDGSLGKYRWGESTKQSLLVREAGRREQKLAEAV